MHAEHTQDSLHVREFTSKALVNSAQNDLVNIRSTKRTLHMHRTMHACAVPFSDTVHQLPHRHRRAWPGDPDQGAHCVPKRDGRVKPGHDDREL